VILQRLDYVLQRIEPIGLHRARVRNSALDAHDPPHLSRREWPDPRDETDGQAVGGGGGSSVRCRVGG